MRSYAEPGVMTTPSGTPGKWYGVARLAFGSLSVALLVDPSDPTVWVVKWDTLREGPGADR